MDIGIENMISIIIIKKLIEIIIFYNLIMQCGNLWHTFVVIIFIILFRLFLVKHKY